MVAIGGAREQSASNLVKRKVDGLTYIGPSPLLQRTIHLKNRPLSRFWPLLSSWLNYSKNFRLGSRRCLSGDKCDKQRRKCLQGKWSKPCSLIPHQTLWPRIKSAAIWWMFKGMIFNRCLDFSQKWCWWQILPFLSPKSSDLKNLKKTKASHFGPSVYHYKLLKGKPTELERLMEAEVTN